MRRASNSRFRCPNPSERTECSLNWTTCNAPQCRRTQSSSTRSRGVCNRTTEYSVIDRSSSHFGDKLLILALAFIGRLTEDRLFFVVHSLFKYGWISSLERLVIATAVTLIFAALARRLRGVNGSGAGAGAVTCFLIFAGAGPWAFAALCALFGMTWGSTRLGYRRKLARGLAERREGRNGWQVLANLAVPALCASIFGVTGNLGWLVAAVGALTEAAIDTVASEIGQFRSSQARMITNGQPVPAGTDGGITISGSVAGMAGGLVVVSVTIGGGLLHPAQFWIPVAAGFAGMLFDSLLGATLQRRGWISNETVNLVATLAAAGLAYTGTVFA